VFSATLRSLRGWSQGDLGKETGISVKALSRLESGLAQVSEANQERIEMALLGESGLAARVVRMELGGLRAMLRSPKYPPVEKQIDEGREVGRQLLRSALEVGLASVESHGGSEEGEDDPEGLRESLLWF
jgi:transcriptional regulator with XRE-family HTH domain